MNSMKEKLEERAVALNEILKEQNTGIQLVYTNQFSDNMEREGYILKKKDTSIAPIVYINPKIPDWWKGSDQEVVDALLRIPKVEVQKEIENFVSHIDRQYILENAYFALVPGERYDQMIHTDQCVDRWCDLAVKYSVSLPGFSEESVSSIRITNSILETYHIKKEELVEACVRNMEQQVTIMSLQEHMWRMLGVDQSEMPELTSEEGFLDVTVITNQDTLDGSGSVLLPSVLKRLDEKYQSSFAVLPSSRHEVLVAPIIDSAMEAVEFQKMVKEVNETQVDPEDFLSNHVYVYKNGNFTIFGDGYLF